MKKSTEKSKSTSQKAKSKKEDPLKADSPTQENNFREENTLETFHGEETEHPTENLSAGNINGAQSSGLTTVKHPFSLNTYLVSDMDYLLLV